MPNTPVSHEHMFRFAAQPSSLRPLFQGLVFVKTLNTSLFFPMADSLDAHPKMGTGVYTTHQDGALRTNQQGSEGGR